MDFKLFIKDEYQHPLLIQHTTVWLIHSHEPHPYYMDIRQDVKDWLNDTVGDQWCYHMAVDWHQLSSQHLPQPYMVEIVLTLENPHMATLFKLTWL